MVPTRSQARCRLHLRQPRAASHHKTQRKCAQIPLGTLGRSVRGPQSTAFRGADVLARSTSLQERFPGGSACSPALRWAAQSMGAEDGLSSWAQGWAVSQPVFSQPTRAPQATNPGSVCPLGPPFHLPFSLVGIVCFPFILCIFFHRLPLWPFLEQLVNTLSSLKSAHSHPSKVMLRWAQRPGEGLQSSLEAMGVSASVLLLTGCQHGLRNRSAEQRFGATAVAPISAHGCLPGEGAVTLVLSISASRSRPLPSGSHWSFPPTFGICIWEKPVFKGS